MRLTQEKRKLFKSFVEVSTLNEIKKILESPIKEDHKNFLKNFLSDFSKTLTKDSFDYQMYQEEHDYYFE